MEIALGWYRSAEYTAIRTLRDEAATVRMFLVDGVD
jgi:uncharacterized protein (DUF1330 family)